MRFTTGDRLGTGPSGLLSRTHARLEPGRQIIHIPRSAASRPSIAGPGGPWQVPFFRPHNTFLEEIGPRRWRAVQRIVDEAGEVDWMLECQVDLTGPRDPDAPLVELVRIGT
jgi:hypothetical protein